MNPHAYPIPAGPVTTETEVKRSRFICDIAPAAGKAEVLAFIEQVRAREPEARHHCWAYIAGHPVSSIERASSDDGEPQGTAGKPMLNVLQHKGIGEIVVVVSRYFGGVKLGAGGLVRAYSASVQQGIDALELGKRVATTEATIRFPFALESGIRRLLEQMDITIVGSNYQNEVYFAVSLPCGREQELSDAVTNHSHGSASVHFPSTE
jgi:uncharacterized YigZ family protein